MEAGRSKAEDPGARDCIIPRCPAHAGGAPLPMTPDQLDARLRFAVAAAHRAGETALAYARDPAGLGTVSKGVQDVVTAADKAVEQALRREIAEAFSAAGLPLEKSEVIMGEGPLRRVGESDVEVHLHADVHTTVKVVIQPES